MANAANSPHLRARYLRMCASVPNSPRLLPSVCVCMYVCTHTRPEMTCAPQCAFGVVRVFWLLLPHHFGAHHTHSHATMSNCTHTHTEWKRRAFCEHPLPLLAPNFPPRSSSIICCRTAGCAGVAWLLAVIINQSENKRQALGQSKHQPPTTPNHSLQILA